MICKTKSKPKNIKKSKSKKAKKDKAKKKKKGKVFQGPCRKERKFHKPAIAKSGATAFLHWLPAQARPCTNK